MKCSFTANCCSIVGSRLSARALSIIFSTILMESSSADWDLAISWKMCEIWILSSAGRMASSRSGPWTLGGLIGVGRAGGGTLGGGIRRAMISGIGSGWSWPSVLGLLDCCVICCNDLGGCSELVT